MVYVILDIKGVDNSRVMFVNAPTIEKAKQIAQLPKDETRWCQLSDTMLEVLSGTNLCCVTLCL